MHDLCFNGVFSDAGTPVIPAANKGYRYGDGFFETLRVHRSAIPLWSFHRNRILKSMDLLDYSFAAGISVAHLYDQIIELCTRNQCRENARVRLSFSNGNGGLFDQSATNYLIEATPLTPLNIAGVGLVLGLYPEMQKERHCFSGLKLANALLFSRAAQFCTRQGWDDCLIQNSRHQVIESCISNLFWIRGKQLFTPPVTEGCVEGVFRAYLMAAEPGIKEESCTPETLKEADELFLTNALRGVREVFRFEDKTYAGHQTAALCQRHHGLLFP
ncbi:aminotransferase class IV [Niabella aurantiaca]|uniref:aminotransferase class IV n=1 Tax=Niabella aurantiaca TaxID=379900 RepID=UPI00035C68BE|nr:aminotransferase class IV [Niabella aurantiaca]